VRPGHRVQIMYSVAGPSPANYADKGIRVTVRQGSRTASVDLLSAAATCVSTRPRIPCPQSFVSRVESVVEREN
jgi:hypothetical protein